MGCLKKLLGIVLFLGGLAGCLYYIPPTILEFDPTTGASLMNFIIKYLPFLTHNYQDLAGQIMFGLGSPVMMLVFSGIALFLGLFLLK